MGLARPAWQGAAAVIIYTRVLGERDDTMGCDGEIFRVALLLNRQPLLHNSLGSRQSLLPNSFTVSFCTLLMAQQFPDLAGSPQPFPSVFLGALQLKGNPFVPLRVLEWETTITIQNAF